MLRDKVGKFVPKPLKRILYRRRRNLTRLINRLRVRDHITTYHDVRLRADPQEIGVDVVENLLSGDYELREARMVDMFLEPHDKVIELGAGIGFIGMLCARVVGGQNVHSFEANPLMEPVIRGNYALNEGIPPNLNIGFLSSEPEGSEDITFYVPDQFWAASLSPIKDARTVKTPQLSLSKYLATLRPTFLIMDIEGGEIDIVDALDPKGLRKIAMELHPSVTCLLYTSPSPRDRG